MKKTKLLELIKELIQEELNEQPVKEVHQGQNPTMGGIPVEFVAGSDGKRYPEAVNSSQQGKLDAILDKYSK